MPSILSYYNFVQADFHATPTLPTRFANVCATFYEDIGSDNLITKLIPAGTQAQAILITR